MGKQTRAEIRKVAEERSDVVLGRIFSDVCGKLPTRSHHGFEYFATFIDDKSRKVAVAGLRKKSEALHHLKVFITQAEVKTGLRTKAIRSDGGGEYDSKAVTKFPNPSGSKLSSTPPTSTMPHLLRPSTI